VLDQETLQQALGEQQCGKGKLLSEVLLALNLIEEKVLVATLNMQASEN
jgi:hypothetical protein